MLLSESLLFSKEIKQSQERQCLLSSHPTSKSGLLLQASESKSMVCGCFNNLVG